MSPSSPTGIDRNLTHYANPGFIHYIRRALLASAGYDEADLERPVIGIADTSSDYTTCHLAMPSSWLVSKAKQFKLSGDDEADRQVVVARCNGVQLGRACIWRRGALRS